MFHPMLPPHRPLRTSLLLALLAGCGSPGSDSNPIGGIAVAPDLLACRAPGCSR